MPATAPDLQAADNLLSVVAAHRLSLNQARVLLAVAHAVTGPTDIAARLELSPSAVGEIFTRLRGRKLLNKQRGDTSDERRITYLLTARGHATILELTRAIPVS